MKKLTLFSALIVFIVLTGASCVSFGAKKTAGTLGMYRSSDRGESWQASMAYPTAEGVKSIATANVYRLFQDPTDANAVYLATRGQGLFYTLDSGASWQSISKFKGQFVYALTIDPKDKCTIYASNGPNIYKTTDCSRTWELIYTEQRSGERTVGLAVDFGNSQVVYSAQYGGDVLVSRDGGKSWEAIKRFGFQLRDIQADNFNPGRIYVASYKNGLARSDDEARTWQLFGENLKQFSGGLTFNRMILHPSQKDSIFWISKYGILRSDDAGASWTALKLLTPPGSVNIYGFAVNPANEKQMYYTGTILGEKNVHVRSTFYKTEDGGQSWVTKKMPTNSIPSYMLIHPENGNMLFLGFMNLTA